MNQEELDEVLRKHKLWLNDEEGGEQADLRWANLQRTDLRWANLQRTDLRGANLHRVKIRGANFRGADFDFSVLPLWCGSFDMKIDRNTYTQILYHLCRMEVDDEDCKTHQKLSRELANSAPVRKRHGLPEIGAVEE